jgi:hypothetical protein
MNKHECCKLIAYILICMIFFIKGIRDKLALAKVAAVKKREFMQNRYCGKHIETR